MKDREKEEGTAEGKEAKKQMAGNILQCLCPLVLTSSVKTSQDRVYSVFASAFPEPFKYALD